MRPILISILLFATGITPANPPSVTIDLSQSFVSQIEEGTLIFSVDPDKADCKLIKTSPGKGKIYYCGDLPTHIYLAIPDKDTDDNSI